MARFFALVTAFLVLFGCGLKIGEIKVEPGHPEPRLIFEKLIQEPVPSSVSALQGYGETWKGYNVWLRFRGEPEFIQSYFASGFEETEWRRIDFSMMPSREAARHLPDWRPGKIRHKRCFIRKNVKNAWTHGGTHYFVIDDSTGVVYFHGIGC